MIIYPAMDLRSGQVVRLRQGDFARQTTYRDHEPLARAQEYAALGAQWIHVVDLDGARDPATRQLALLTRLAAGAGLAMQVGGGIRRADDIQGLLDAGIRRVIVGSLACQDPAIMAELLRTFGSERLVLALDLKDGKPAIHGWQETAKRDAFQVIDPCVQAGLRHLLCTDIAKDGMMSGPNIGLYCDLRARYPSLAIQASGGIAKLEDLSALARAGCAGAIIGKALFEGAIDLRRALEVSDHAG
ncbi:MAG: 1-(5-phosphoribosyl)-5-[(5-phosphoribosylamino)methylideneamino]imidazole-4-carboxamide isomerase [Pseudomonadota bacterium]